MQFLQNEQQVQDFINTIQKCKGPVYLTDWRVDEQGEPNIKINLKSSLSLYLGIADLISLNGDWFEVHCYDREDENLLMEFFINKAKSKVKFSASNSTSVNSDHS